MNDLDTTQSSSYKSIDNNDFANKRDRNDNKNNKNLNLLKTGKLVVSNNNKKKLFYLGRQYCEIFARLGNDKKQQTRFMWDSFLYEGSCEAINLWKQSRLCYISHR